MTEKKSNIVKDLLNAFKVPIILVGILWIIHLWVVTFGVNVREYALVPRRVYGLWGIISSPLFHSDWGHLLNNTFPLLFTGSIMYYFYKKSALPSIFIIHLMTGLAVWLFGHHGYHIGASGVAYGMVSFIFWSGIFRREVEAIVLALIVVILYSGMIVGIFPDEPGISWESHLFGALMGLLTAILFMGVDKPEREERTYNEGIPQYYFPRDVFDLTKAERQAALRHQQMLAQQQRMEEYRRQQSLRDQQDPNLDIN